MQLTDYIKPELIAVAVVLYFIGLGIKKTKLISCRFIPLINGVCGIVICLLYILATSDFASGKDVAMAAFTAVTQGILVAGLSTYVHQMVKQIKTGKTEEDGKT